MAFNELGENFRMSSLSQRGLGQALLNTLLCHSRQLENYSDDLIWQMDRIGSYTDDILKLVDEFGDEFVEAFQKSGDEAITNYNILLENEFDSNIRNKFIIKSIWGIIIQKSLMIF